MNLLLYTHVLSHHRDPFDRMLAAQAKVEKLTLVTRDFHLKKYGIKILEA